MRVEIYLNGDVIEYRLGDKYENGIIEDMHANDEGVLRMVIRVKQGKKQVAYHNVPFKFVME